MLSSNLYIYYTGVKKPNPIKPKPEPEEGYYGLVYSGFCIVVRLTGLTYIPEVLIVGFRYYPQSLIGFKSNPIKNFLRLIYLGHYCYYVTSYFCYLFEIPSQVYVYSNMKISIGFNIHYVYSNMNRLLGSNIPKSRINCILTRVTMI